MVLITLGGCAVFDVEDDDGGPVLLTAEEREAWGYEHPVSKLNSSVQRLANRERAQIYSVVQPYVERKLGRRVEMTGIEASYPYRAVDVSYRTLSEPVIASVEHVGLRQDGTVASEASIAVDGTAFPYETVNGLFHMAFREEIAQMKAYLTVSYPQFSGGVPERYARQRALVDPMFTFAYWKRGRDSGVTQRSVAAGAAVYEAYLDEPHRDDVGWREVFEGVGAQAVMGITVRLVLADDSEGLSEDLTRRIGDDLRVNPLFARFGGWDVSTYSNAMVRDDVAFHHSFQIVADSDGRDWYVEEWADGGWVRS